MANNGSENTHKLHRGKENCTEGDQSDCLHLTKQRKKITFRQRFCLRKNGDLSMVSAVVSINQRKIKRNLSIHFAILCCWWCNGLNNASLLKGYRFKSRWTKNETYLGCQPEGSERGLRNFQNRRLGSCLLDFQMRRRWGCSSTSSDCRPSKPDLGWGAMLEPSGATSWE